MKFYSILINLLLCSSILVAQEVPIESGPEINNPDPANFWTQKLGSDESGHYLLREFGPVTNKSIVLEKYDLGFNLLFSKDIESSNGIFGDSKNHFETILGNGEIFVFLSSWKKATGESGLWVQRYSNEGEKVGEETQLLNEKGTTMLKSSAYKISLSPDGSKMAVLEEPTFSKGAKESCTTNLFNTNDFSKIIENEFTFDTDMKRYPRNQILVNNQGVAFAFKEVKVSGKEFKYYLTSLGKESKFQEELNFELYQVNQSKFIIDNKGNLVGIGILAEAKKFTTLWQKTWQLKANANGVVKSIIEPLGTDLLSKLMSEKKAAKEGTSLNYYQIKDLLQKPNGGFLLITEFLDKRKTALPAVEGQPTKYTYKFKYGSIVTLSINNDMTRDWNSVYVKKHSFDSPVENVQYGSFAYGIINNKLNIIYNYSELFIIMGNYGNRYWVDKSGAKIKVKDVFGEEAIYPTFLSSINLSDGSLNYSERTFSALPLSDLYQKNNFAMSVDPSFFFFNESSITVFSRTKGPTPKKIKFSTIKLN